MTFYPGHSQNKGVNNPRYKDGRFMYRNMVDRSSCQVCGKKRDPKNPQSIEVHHRDGDRSHNTEDNLIPLCTHCHHVRAAIKCGTIVADVSEAQFPLEVELDG